jgi:hypothetical protein
MLPGSLAVSIPSNLRRDLNHSLGNAQNNADCLRMNVSGSLVVGGTAQIAFASGADNSKGVPRFTRRLSASCCLSLPL